MSNQSLTLTNGNVVFSESFTEIPTKHTLLSLILRIVTSKVVFEQLNTLLMMSTLSVMSSAYRYATYATFAAYGTYSRCPAGVTDVNYDQVAILVFPADVQIKLITGRVKSFL